MISTSLLRGANLHERAILDEWAVQKGDAGVRDYWAEKNVSSIDGLPAIDPPPAT